MRITKLLAFPEIDGDRLKIAREALGLSQNELSAKLCLSHRHIAQLEANQLAIFFSPAHKVQVAKKVGLALGLEEDEYLKYRTNIELVQFPEPDTISSTSNHLPNNSELFSLNKDQPIAKRNAFLIPTIFAGVIGLGIGVQIYSKELSILDIAQLIDFKAPMSQLHTLSPKAPELEKPNSYPDIASTIASTEHEAPAKFILPENCSFQESHLSHYQTTNPSKKGEMVFILSKENQSICVIDNQNTVVTLDLAAGD